MQSAESRRIIHILVELMKFFNKTVFFGGSSKELELYD